MHYHVEVVLTPKDLKEWENVSRVVEKAMNSARPAIGWDWYVIGGRWSGDHTLAMMSSDGLKKFWQEFEKLGLGWTSAEHPEEERRKAAWALWKEHFPQYRGTPPVYRNCYAADGLGDDVIDVIDCPPRLGCYTLVLPKGPKGTHERRSRVRILEVEKYVPGQGFKPTEFDGKIAPVLKREGIEDGKIVTVDIHS